MFDYLREITLPGKTHFHYIKHCIRFFFFVAGSPQYVPHFNLVLLDLKIRRLSDKAKSTAGILMADRLIDRLFSAEQTPIRLRLVLGLELTSDYPFVYALVDRFQQRNYPALLDRIGFDVSGKTRELFKSLTLEKLIFFL